MQQISKFPRTRHLEGSRLQPGDQDLSQIPFSEIAGRFLVVEEKVDGANCGISFDDSGSLRLQSRGHYLKGGAREKQFAMLKRWASEIAAQLFERLSDRFLVYGEWMFAKHTIFYNSLSHYFLEFDVLDRQTGQFLGTDRRRELLQGLPFRSVPVVYKGKLKKQDEIVALLGPSAFINNQLMSDLGHIAEQNRRSFGSLVDETDSSGLMEGLYIKVEEEGRVVDRMKYVRADFLAVVDQSGSHWQDRPLIRNLLRTEDRSRRL